MNKNTDKDKIEVLEDVEIIKPNSNNTSSNNDNKKGLFDKYKKFISPVLMGLIGIILITNSE